MKNSLATLAAVFALAVSRALAAPELPINELPINNELNRHAIAINSEGRAIDPTMAVQRKGDQRLDPKEYATQLERIFTDIEERDRRGELKKKAVLLWVHGGNNFITGAIKRADQLKDEISADGYYPISICWSSNIPSAWWEQMAYVRNGVYFKKQNSAWAWATAPVYIATDFATALVRLPRTALDKLYSTGKPVAPNAYDKIRAAEFRYQVLRARQDQAEGRDYLADPRFDTERYAREIQNLEIPQESLDRGRRGSAGAKITMKNGELSPQKVAAKWWPKYDGQRPMSVSKGDFKLQPAETAKRTASFVATVPTKAVVLGAFATLGQSAWDMLNRRCKAMFHHTNSFRPGSQAFYNETDDDLADSQSTGIGAMAVFLRRLEQFCKKHPDIQVVAIGHSMGAIVLNEAVREFPRVPYRDIVYMAAACSIRDFDASVVPYLRSHRRTQFYNLCLHPRAEDRESNFHDLVPRGSFLVWIDEFLNQPQSFPDRTLGNFENAMLASKIFHPKVQGQMHMSAMGAGPNQPDPQKHGDFSGKKFWREAFWKRRGWEKWPLEPTNPTKPTRP